MASQQNSSWSGVASMTYGKATGQIPPQTVLPLDGNNFRGNPANFNRQPNSQLPLTFGGNMQNYTAYNQSQQHHSIISQQSLNSQSKVPAVRFAQSAMTGTVPPNIANSLRGGMTYSGFNQGVNIENPPNFTFKGLEHPSQCNFSNISTSVTNEEVCGSDTTDVMTTGFGNDVTPSSCFMKPSTGQGTKHTALDADLDQNATQSGKIILFTSIKFKTLISFIGADGVFQCY